MIPTLLVIDDDAELTKVIKLIFSARDYNVIIANSAREVDELLRQGPNHPIWSVNLVLLDLLMPLVSGVEMYGRLRAQPAMSKIPIIVLSAVSDIEKRVELLEMGADDYLVKPCSIDELLARTQIHIKLSQLRQAREFAEARVERQVQHIAAINTISHHAAQYFELEPMLSDVAERILQNFPCEQCAFFLYDAASEMWLLKAAAGPFSEPEVWELLSRCVTEGVDYWRGHSKVALIRRGDEIVGAAYFHCEDSTALSHDAEQALLLLMVQLATSITNVKLFQDIQQQNQQLTMIAEENERLLHREQQQRQQAEQLRHIGQVLSASLELSRVMEMGLASFQSMVPAGAAAILLRDEASGELNYAATLPEDHVQRIGARHPLSAQVIASAEILIVDDANREPLLRQENSRQDGSITSLMLVPLVAGQNVLGLIEMSNHQGAGFKELDVALISTAATSLAIAIENARLYERRAELVAQLQSSQAQLVQSEKMAATGRLAASMAHEINNPLQAIHSSLQLVLQFDLDADKHEMYLHMADEETERLITIVTRILEFSRPTNDIFQLVNVNKIIGQVMGLASKHISYQDVEVRHVLASDIPLLEGVPDQLAQVFLNLVLNALDAIPGSGTLTIKTRLRPGNLVDISFADTGIGMSRETRARVFEPFFSTKQGHSGLGLAISYGIIERHHGKINIYSRPDRGSLVVVTLPLSQSE